MAVKPTDMTLPSLQSQSNILDTDNSSSNTPSYDPIEAKPTAVTNDAPVWSILPSYHMYNALYRGIHLNEEDDLPDLPPTYHRDSISSPSLMSDVSLDSGIPLQHTPPTRSINSTNSLSSVHSHNVNSTTNSRFILADEQANWQETILDNTNLLKNLTDTSNPDSNAIAVKIHFTKDICEFGKEPIEIDPSIFEYKQGDYLNGYVTIENSSDHNIPFELFYLVFEGTVKIIDGKTRKLIHARNFLQMFDFSGSWNEGHINRLITEFENPFECPDIVDSDGSYLSFASDKIIKPNRVYKRFFTFKIPNFLLDTECNEHNLSAHVQLPPSMGCPTIEKPGPHVSPVKDFTMLDTSITYGVLARFIGRKSRYNVDKSLFNSDDTILINSKGDEFLILKEEYNYVRILQQSNKLTKNEQVMKFTENKLMHDNLINRIREKIDFGKQLRESLQSQQYDASIDMTRRFSDTDLELAKLRQSYQSTVRDIKYTPKIKDDYVFNYLLTKKTFAGSTKQIGTLQVNTPKKEYEVTYIPPIQFRLSPLTEEDIKTWTLNVPIEFKFTFPHATEASDYKKIPEVKSISADLVVLTIKTEKYPIPIEFHHDIIFQAKTNKVHEKHEFRDTDTFENNIVKPFQILSTELYHVAKDLGDNFKLDKQFVDDVKSICQLQSKCHNLWIEDLKIEVNNKLATLSPKSINSVPWKDESSNQYSKSFNMVLNLESAVLKTIDQAKNKTKAYDSFSLVPNFQYCRMARLYFIRVSIGLSNNQKIHIKLPVSVQK